VVDLGLLIEQAFAGYASVLKPENDAWMTALGEFFAERELHLFERRGFRPDEGRAVRDQWRRPASAFRRVDALAQARQSKDFETLAVLFKRVKNITKGFDAVLTAEARAKLVEPAEVALLNEVDTRLPAIDAAVAQEKYGDAMRELGGLSVPVDKFFVDVLVMAEDRALRDARLALLTALRRTILNIADIAEIAPEETKQA
jgi:glycyl-tRNA synthetase beta chain